MPSFFTAAEKAALSQPFNDIHDTWKQPIVMFKSVSEVVISTNPDHNPFFPGAPGNDTVQTITQSGVFQARIKYMTREDLGFFNTTTQGYGSDQNSFKIEEGMVRLKLDVSGAAYLADTKNVVFDGTMFEKVTSKRPHGLFTAQYYDFFLKKVN